MGHGCAQPIFCVCSLVEKQLHSNIYLRHDFFCSSKWKERKHWTPPWCFLTGCKQHLFEILWKLPLWLRWWSQWDAASRCWCWFTLYVGSDVFLVVVVVVVWYVFLPVSPPGLKIDLNQDLRCPESSLFTAEQCGGFITDVVPHQQIFINLSIT